MLPLFAVLAKSHQILPKTSLHKPTGPDLVFMATTKPCANKKVICKHILCKAKKEMTNLYVFFDQVVVKMLLTDDLVKLVLKDDEKEFFYRYVQRPMFATHVFARQGLDLMRKDQETETSS